MAGSHVLLIFRDMFRHSACLRVFHRHRLVQIRSLLHECTTKGVVLGVGDRHQYIIC